MPPAARPQSDAIKKNIALQQKIFAEFKDFSLGKKNLLNQDGTTKKWMVKDYQNLQEFVDNATKELTALNYINNLKSSDFNRSTAPSYPISALEANLGRLKYNKNTLMNLSSQTKIQNEITTTLIPEYKQAIANAQVILDNYNTYIGTVNDINLTNPPAYISQPFLTTKLNQLQNTNANEKAKFIGSVDQVSTFNNIADSLAALTQSKQTVQKIIPITFSAGDGKSHIIEELMKQNGLAQYYGGSVTTVSLSHYDTLAEVSDKLAKAKESKKPMMILADEYANYTPEVLELINDKTKGISNVLIPISATESPVALGDLSREKNGNTQYQRQQEDVQKRIDGTQALIEKEGVVQSSDDFYKSIATGINSGDVRQVMLPYNFEAHKEEVISIIAQNLDQTAGYNQNQDTNITYFVTFDPSIGKYHLHQVNNEGNIIFKQQTKTKTELDEWYGGDKDNNSKGNKDKVKIICVYGKDSVGGDMGMMSKNVKESHILLNGTENFGDIYQKTCRNRSLNGVVDENTSNVKIYSDKSDLLNILETNQKNHNTLMQKVYKKADIRNEPSYKVPSDDVFMKKMLTPYGNLLEVMNPLPFERKIPQQNTNTDVSNDSQQNKKTNPNAEKVTIGTNTDNALNDGTTQNIGSGSGERLVQNLNNLQEGNKNNKNASKNTLNNTPNTSLAFQNNTNILSPQKCQTMVYFEGVKTDAELANAIHSVRKAVKNNGISSQDIKDFDAVVVHIADSEEKYNINLSKALTTWCEKDEDKAQVYQAIRGTFPDQQLDDTQCQEKFEKMKKFATAFQAEAKKQGLKYAGTENGMLATRGVIIGRTLREVRKERSEDKNAHKTRNYGEVVNIENNSNISPEKETPQIGIGIGDHKTPKVHNKVASNQQQAM